MKKQYSLYRKLTGEPMTWLKYQWKEEDRGKSCSCV
jgi:hypothetical protein